MIRLVELGAFILVSAAVHAGILWQMDDPGLRQGQGDDGSQRITMTAASGDMDALMQQWDTAPPSADMPVMPMPMPPTAPIWDIASDKPPDRPTATPTMSAQMPHAGPTIETTPAPPPPLTRGMDSSPRPLVRPHQVASRPPASTARPARVASGSGGGDTQGTTATQSPQTALSEADRQSLRAQWAAQIMGQIERARPRARGRGSAALSLLIQRDGRLSRVSLAQSSGDAALDQAALSAIRGIGRFPAAPSGLPDDSLFFDVNVHFN